MAEKGMEVQEKQELDSSEERTEAARYYRPYTDIHESADAVIVTMDMPGVDKKDVDVKLEKDVLTITGHVDPAGYEGLEPVYTEYNVGNYVRSFSISNEVDRDAISAKVDDGVLTVRLPKVKEASARRITVD